MRSSRTVVAGAVSKESNMSKTGDNQLSVSRKQVGRLQEVLTRSTKMPYMEDATYQTMVVGIQSQIDKISSDVEDYQEVSINGR